MAGFSQKFQEEILSRMEEKKKPNMKLSIKKGL